MLQTRLIDLSDYEDEDLVFKNIIGSSLSITTTGSPTVIVNGKDGDLDKEVPMAVIDMSTYSKSDKIEGEGAFLVSISGMDKIVLTVSGTGKIKVKEME